MKLVNFLIKHNTIITIFAISIQIMAFLLAVLIKDYFLMFVSFTFLIIQIYLFRRTFKK